MSDEMFNELVDDVFVQDSNMNQDIIKLDAAIGDELDVFVGNIKKFKALPGSASDNYAVRVTSIIREE